MPGRDAVSPREVIGVFAKAPVPGVVKTRLAAAIGSEAAAELYRRLGQRVVSAAAASRRAVVWYAPPGRRVAVTGWLDGVRGIAYRAQPAGSLGRRLETAFAWHFAHGAGRVVIVGTDCPGVGRSVLARAFRALRSADVVLGPALDGGYYLIGLTAPHPELFRRVAWSTGLVLRATRARARALGLSCRVLDLLRDVDTANDARALGLLPG